MSVINNTQIRPWLRVTAAVIAGCTATLADASTNKVYVEADAYVYSRYSAMNYGTGGTLCVGDYEPANNYAYAYTKFDICNYVDLEITSAKLYLYCVAKYSGNLPADAFECTNDNWRESEITWGSKPAWGTNALSSTTVTAINTWYSWDVTSAVQNAQSEDDGFVTLMVKPSSNTINQYCKFASYENSEGTTTDPYLYITWESEDQWDPIDWDILIPTVNQWDLRDPEEAIDLGQWEGQEPANSGTTIDCVYDADDFLFFSDNSATTVYYYHQSGGYIENYADDSDGLNNIHGIVRYCGLFGIACGKYEANGPLGGRGAGGRVALFDGPHSFVGNLIEDDSDPYDFYVLPDGRVLLSDTTIGSGNVRLYESDGETFNVLFYTEQPRQLACRPSTGNYLVVSRGSGTVIEFDLEGNIYLTWPFANGMGVFELANGRLLLSGDDGLFSMNPSDPDDLVQLSSSPGQFINAVPTNFVACCFPDGTCADLMEVDCVNQGGTWLGFGTKCATFQCPDGPDDYVASSSGVTGVNYSDAQWGDFDNDGDLDLVVCGQDNNDQVVTKTYENQSGLLALKQDLVGVYNTGSGCLAWGDYDGDGDLDLAVAGMGDPDRITRIYENEDGAGNLVWDTDQVLTPVNTASLAWGDYDNDGDLDLVVTGNDGTSRVAHVYRNEPLGTLTVDPDQPLTGVVGGSADWGDYDGDGDLDLITTGYDGSSRRTIFYENDPPGTLNNDGDHGLPGINLSDTAWGDYDSDGDLDLAWVGETAGGGPRYARVYRNDGVGNFSQVAELMYVYRSSCAWGDYDNDGDLDVAFCGYTGTSLQTNIFENTGGGFADSFWFDGRYEGSLSFADVDQDYDLDFLVTGYDWYTAYAELYEKRGGYVNTPPTPPIVLNGQGVDGGLHLSWQGASDFQTPTDGLYYCLRVGTESGAHDVMSGTYGSPLFGNVHQATEITLDLPPGEYYWSVCTIDSGLLASAWSAEMFSEVGSECPGDVNSDSVVDIDDIFAVLAAWGPCDDCPEDVNDDGVVDIDDLFAVLAEWGPCP